jgi:hypothetical protein
MRRLACAILFGHPPVCFDFVLCPGGRNQIPWRNLHLGYFSTAVPIANSKGRTGLFSAGSRHGVAYHSVSDLDRMRSRGRLSCHEDAMSCM